MHSHTRYLASPPQQNINVNSTQNSKETNGYIPIIIQTARCYKPNNFIYCVINNARYLLACVKVLKSLNLTPFSFIALCADFATICRK
jgi:hypothetical protein